MATNEVTIFPTSTVSAGNWRGSPGAGTNLHTYLQQEAGLIYDPGDGNPDTCEIGFSGVYPEHLEHLTLVYSFRHEYSDRPRTLWLTLHNSANELLWQDIDITPRTNYRTRYRTLPSGLPPLSELKFSITAGRVASWADSPNPVNVREFHIIASASVLINPEVGAAAPPGIAPQEWHASTLTRRAYTHGSVILRHPQMPVGMPSTRAFQVANGAEVTAQRFQDHLVLGGSPPYLVYWNRDEGAALTSVTEAEYLTALDGNRNLGFWSGVEIYHLDRNLVAPSFTVHVNDVDMSAYLFEFSPDSVTFVGPPSIAEVLQDGMMFITIKAGESPIYSGILVRSDTKPYANVRQITFSMLTPGRYFDVDLSEADMRDFDSVPATEAGYIYKLLRAAGFTGLLAIDFDATLRNLAFWQAVPPDGPGFDVEEIYDLYRNLTQGTSWQSLQAVANANMMQLFEMPDGNLMLSPILPLYDSSVETLITDALLNPENGYVRVYCDPGDGTFVPDPRLDIQSISLAFDENFAEIEVEAFSNSITSELKVFEASFVQGNPSVENKYFEITLPAMAVDSTVGDWPDTLPWLFRKLEASVPKQYVAPATWFKSEGASTNPWRAVDGYSTPIDTWGIGSRWFTVMEWYRGQLQNVFPAGTERDELIAQGVALDDVIYYGFGGGATGSYFAGATWRLTCKIPQIDTATLRVVPKIGKFTREFAPAWFPVLDSVIMQQKANKPRKARRNQNQLVAEMSSTYAVQVPQTVTDMTAVLGMHYYDSTDLAAANHLATWLTCREVMRSRQVEIRYAGAHSWPANTFMAIARRPPSGVGGNVEWYDLLWVMDVPRVSGRVNGEVWTSVRCGYVGAYNINTQEALYEMPLSWGGPWDIRGGGSASSSVPVGNEDAYLKNADGSLWENANGTLSPI